MNSSRVNSWDCLKIAGLNLPKTGVAFSTLILQFLVIHGTIHALHRLVFSRFHLSPIVSQLFAGIILAPRSPLGLGETRIYQNLHDVVFPVPSHNVDETLAMFGYMLFLFVVGVKMDFSIILRTGRKAYVIGILDLIVPVLTDLAYIHYLYKDFFQRIRTDSDVGDLYVNMTIIPLTHFPNTVVLLSDLKMTNSELGRLALSSSLIGHIVSIAIGARKISTLTRHADPTIPLLVPFTLVMVGIFVIRPILQWMIKQTPKDRPIKQVFLYWGYVFMFMGALATHFSGQLVLLGAFVVGSVVPDGLPLGAAMVEKLDFLLYGLLLPFFVTRAAMAGNYNGIGTSYKMIFYHVSLAIVSYVSKFLTNLACGLCSKLPFTDALALSFIMCTKGIVDIGLSTITIGSKVVTRPCYTIIILWTTFAATISPHFVRSLYHPLRKYAGFQRRDIMHCKQNSELRILACFFRSERVSSITRFLNACCPSQNNPIILYALHLVKLIGRVHPAFISHDTQRKKASTNSYSEDVVLAFSRFQQTINSPFLSVAVFTAASQFNDMHEDMCTLALDKLVSLILLPYHRRFRMNGSVCSDDSDQKMLNSSILNKSSPCSVAILVDRGLFGMSSTTSVAVVYIGGRDDQETTALAMRLGRSDERVRVSVIRLVAYGQLNDLDSLDSGVLTDVQNNVVYNKQFSYMEKTVRDGGDTATFLKSNMEAYDVVMVGRHYKFGCAQLMGLKDFSEDTQLGAIGDFLASPDFECTTSVLVVQHQRQWAFK